MSLVQYNNPWNLFNQLQRELINPELAKLNDDENVRDRELGTIC